MLSMLYNLLLRHAVISNVVGIYVVSAYLEASFERKFLDFFANFYQNRGVAHQ